MLHVIEHSFIDIIKTFPFLLIVYIIIEVIERKLHSTPAILSKATSLGPVFGSLLGSFPQCGFSAASSALYNSGVIMPATLISVFLATSDEAIPIMLSQKGAAKEVLMLIVVKIIIAIIFGYLYKFTVYRKMKPLSNNNVKISTQDYDSCSCCQSGIFTSAIFRTIKISVFLVVTLIIINLIIHYIGEDTLATLLLNGSILQPALCALIGLIPGCTTSVLLTQLFLNGSISFASAIAGLSTGAGFGYIVLLSDKKNKKNAFKIIALTYIAATLSGTILQFIL